MISLRWRHQPSVHSKKKNTCQELPESRLGSDPPSREQPSGGFMSGTSRGTGPPGWLRSGLSLFPPHPSTYRTSSPHHMNRHHRHPPLPPANKRCFEVALPSFVTDHGTTTEPLHGRGRLKSSLERKKGVRRENTRHSHGTITASEGSNVPANFSSVLPGCVPQHQLV